MKLSLALLLSLCASAARNTSRPTAPPRAAVSVPALPAAAVPASVRPEGQAAAAASLSQTAKDAAPQIEAAQAGKGDARETGEQLQRTLEQATAKPAAAEVPEAPEAPLPGALPAAYARAVPAAVAEARFRKASGTPALIGLRQDGKAWVFDFAAGGIAMTAYVTADPKQRVYASFQGDYKPEVSLEWSPADFKKKLAVTPAKARQAAAKLLGLSAKTLLVEAGPRAKSRDLWYEISAEDGRSVSVNARTGAAKLLPAGPPRSEAESYAKLAAMSKGPYSETEWNVDRYRYEEGLRKKGGNWAQVLLYRRLTAAAPIRGGRFSSWSGD